MSVGGPQTGALQAAAPQGASLPAAAAQNVAAAPAQPGLTPQERLANYAEHLEARLANLEAAESDSGLNLDGVREQFQHNLERLNHAIGQGMRGDDLARAVQNTVDMMRDGVREAMDLPSMRAPDPSQPVDTENALERLQALQDHYRTRLDSYLENLGPENSQAQNASERFDHNFARLREALETGSMSIGDVRNAIQNTMAHLTADLNGTTTFGMTAGTGSGTNGAEATASQAQLPEPEAGPVAQAATQAMAHEANLLSLLNGPEGNEQLSLVELWSQRSNFSKFMSGVQQDSRQARSMGPSTYGPQAQLLSLLSSAGNPGLDLAV